MVASGGVSGHFPSKNGGVKRVKETEKISDECIPIDDLNLQNGEALSRCSNQYIVKISVSHSLTRPDQTRVFDSILKNICILRQY